MPHVIVKVAAGKSDAQKQDLADAVTKAVMSTLNYGEEAVSVAIEDVPAQRWVEDVYKPEILRHSGRLFKKPGYDPLK